MDLFFFYIGVVAGSFARVLALKLRNETDPEERILIKRGLYATTSIILTILVALIFMVWV